MDEVERARKQEKMEVCSARLSRLGKYCCKKANGGQESSEIDEMQIELKLL